MKRFMLIILISVFASFGFANANSTFGSDSNITFGSDVIAGGDNGVPWPFGLEQPFPWSKIQGLWEAEVDGWPRFFIFKTLGNSNSRKLQIYEYDGITCDLISKGSGFEEERVLTAGMVGNEGRVIVQVRAFKESDVKRQRHIPSTYASSKMMMALSIAPFSNPKARVTYLLTRVSPNPVLSCD